MKQIPRSLQYLSVAQRKTAIDEIINYFATEREESIGIIAAEALLDAFLATTGEHIYNKALNDSKIFFKNNFDQVIANHDIELMK